MPTVHWGPHADRSKVSQHSLDVVLELLRRSGNDSAVITSTVRSPEDDARVLHDNLVREGVDAQRRLYLAPGNQVIDVFIADAAKTRDETIADMAAKIRELGPYHVSHHCLSDEDLERLNVLDISPVQLAHPQAFVAECRKEAPPAKTGGLLSKLLEPPHDPGIHLEIPQPAPDEVPHGS
jgi:hypothetical protein